MQSLYTIYFNNGNDVTPLFYTKGYTAAEAEMEDTAKSFVKRFFTEETPCIIKKYEESTPFMAKVKADVSFPSGVIFAKKMHDACVYEKICYPGTMYNTYSVKFLGRIGVLCQQQEISEHHTEYINVLKAQIDQKDRMVSQQELIIKRLEAEVSRLEKSVTEIRKSFENMLNSKSFENEVACLEQKAIDAQYTPSHHTPVDYILSVPDAPPAPKPVSVSNFAKIGQITGDVLQELNKLFEEKNALDADRQRKKEDDRIFDELISEIENLGYFE
jgi:hypothetical protein